MYYGNPATRDYDAGSNWGTITSPTVNLLAGSPGISWWMWYSTEGSGWDEVYLFIDAGAGWQLIGGPWSGSSGGWLSQSIDLTPWAGLPVQFLFNFDTYDSVGNAYEGVYIDEIVIDGTCP